MHVLFVGHDAIYNRKYNIIVNGKNNNRRRKKAKDGKNLTSNYVHIVVVTLINFHIVPYYDGRRVHVLHAHVQHEHKSRNVLHEVPKDLLNMLHRLNINQKPAKLFNLKMSFEQDQMLN